MCLDYRHVNKHLATDVYPLPRLEELVDQAAGHNFYATLDMREAYFQIILDENSRDLTAFSDGKVKVKLGACAVAARGLGAHLRDIGP